MVDLDYQDAEKKYRAKSAVDTILAAEQHKKDPELKEHIDAEMKERHKHLKAAMGSKAEKKKPAKKAEPKKAPAPMKKAPAQKKK